MSLDENAHLDEGGTSMTQVLVVPERRLKLFNQYTGLGSLVETCAELGLVKIQKDRNSDDEQGI